MRAQIPVRRHLTLLLVPFMLLVAGVAVAATQLPAASRAGLVGPKYHVTGNGRFLRPDGRLTTVGDFPLGSALTPNGRYVWVGDCGYGQDDSRVINVKTGRVVQVLPLPGCYGGIAFSPSGRRAYVDGEPQGTSPTEGKVTCPKGDCIHVYTVNPRTGKGIEQTPLQIPASTGGTGRTDSLPPVSGVGTAYPEGMAVSPNGNYLVVALNTADRADVVNLKTDKQTLVSIGEYPEGVTFDSKGRAYVSNEYSGTISVIDPASAKVTHTITGVGGALGDLGSHPEGMAADPLRPLLYVAVANRDLIAVIDTTTDKVTRLISVARKPALGTEPVSVAISPGETTLYAADANEDAIAVVSLQKRSRNRRIDRRYGYIPGFPADKLIGRIPTAAYPDSVDSDLKTKQLVWVAGKGFGSGPNPTYYFGGGKTSRQAPATTYGTYVLEKLIGRVGVLRIPTDRQVQRETRIANAQVKPDDPENQPAGSPIPASTGHPSAQIKHVFYIVRENRVYDQIFGSDPRGNGDKGLELFDTNGVTGPTGGITPNAHAIATRWPLLDNFYEDSEVSVDGHIITAGAYANDYVQKAVSANYSGRRGTYDFGIFPVTNPPNGYIFDQAAKQHVSFEDDGEAVGTVATDGAANRPYFDQVESHVYEPYPDNIFIGCEEPGVEASCTQDSGLYRGTGTVFAGQSRFDIWYPHFEQEVATNSVPTLTYMILPNDHTNGTTVGDPTPQAFVADNDLALGQIVDAISHSKIWPSTAIFVVEDDSQDGADHVDSHRAPAFVISPWARQNVVVNARYDQYSVLRTIELITGLDPLSLNDGLATPMYDAFISGSEKPDDAPYNVIEPTYKLTTKNTKNSADATLSDELPWNRIDQVPQAISDQILYASVHGAKAPPPPAGPNASPDEVERAIMMRLLLAQEYGSHTRSTRCPISWACKPAPPGDP